MTKRIFDIFLSITLLLIFFIPMLLLGILIKVTSRGPALHWSKRVGKNNNTFAMPKFRSMKIDTPEVASHLIQNPKAYLTPTGNFLRKSSLDELPQLFSVLKGDMSFVGPRPALFNQDDLIDLRTKAKVEILRPGITGWAQINGRDELPIPIKVKLDEYYLKNQSLYLDLKIILMTLSKIFSASGVSH